MEFKPRLPKRNSNVSHQSPFKDFSTLMLGIIAIFVAIYFSLGLVIDQTVEYVSPQAEAKFFANFDHQLFVDIHKQEPDKQVQQQWQQVLNKIEYCAQVGYPIDLTVVNAKQINALAFPGGKVIVFSGLNDVLVSENAMAFVLAHELAHFSNRDHLRMMGRGVVLMAIPL